MGIGGLLTHFFACWRAAKAVPSRKLRCIAFYCPEEDGTTTVTFRITHIGNETARNVKMRFQCHDDDQLREFNYCVDELLKCERLDDDSKCGVRKSGNSFRSCWEYLNPRDEIELYVHMDQCNHPHELQLELDGEQIRVARKRIKMHCG